MDNKRYHTLNYFYKNKFGIKVFKVSLNGGFSCPNLDGKVGFGGCIYCSKSGSGEFGGDVQKTLTEQFYEMRDIVNKKHIPCKYIGCETRQIRSQAKTRKQINEFHQAIDMPLLFPQFALR